MQEIIQYLSNPLQAGVSISWVTADFFIMPKFVEKVVDAVKKDKIKSDEEIIEELNSVIEEVDAEYFPFMGNYAYVFRKAIGILGETQACPTEVKTYLDSPEGINQIELQFARMKIAAIDASLKSRLEFYFHDIIFDDIQDALSLDAIEIENKREIAFEIIGIKEQGVARFVEFLKHVPAIGETVRILKAEKSFSERYALRPYPLAVRLWLNSNSTNIPETLKKLLKASVNYISDREWRTGAVLSAIALESILAELCEEKQINAKDDMLGPMFGKLKKKIIFPKDVEEAFQFVNTARKLAVHLKEQPITPIDSIRSLFGTTKFIVWYSSEYKLNPSKFNINC